MGRRTILLIAAILVAAAGTALVFVYARGADTRALGAQRLVAVLVATKAVAAGTSVAAAQSAGSFERREIAANSVVPQALADTSSVADLTFLTAVVPGEQLLRTKVGQPQDQVRLPIPSGKIGISVQLDDPARVADFVAPGSEVAIFTTIASTSNGGSGAPETRLLLERITVLAVGATTTQSTTVQSTDGQQQTSEVPKTILTLALNQKEAQKLVFAIQNGQMYFGLLTESSKVVPGGGTSGKNLFQ